MAVAGSLATAVASTGIRSFAETFTSDRDAIARLLPFYVPTEHADAAVPVATATPAVAEAAEAAPAPIAVAAPTVIAPSVAAPPIVLPAAHAVAATPTLTFHSIKPAAYGVPAEHPAFAPASSVASSVDFNDAPFAVTRARPLADRAGHAIEIVDAGPISAVGPIASAVPTAIRPAVVAALPDALEPEPSLPVIARVPAAVTGAAVPDAVGNDLPWESLDHFPGIDTGPAADDLTWENVIQAGVTDFPRGNSHTGFYTGDGTWIPGGEQSPWVTATPEPTTLLTIGIASVALLGRRRRK